MRLIVELTPPVNDDLDWITKIEEVNKTTAVNRALQVYRLVAEAQRSGEKLVLRGEDGEREVRLI